MPETRIFGFVLAGTGVCVGLVAMAWLFKPSAWVAELALCSGSMLVVLGGLFAMWPAPGQRSDEEQRRTLEQGLDILRGWAATQPGTYLRAPRCFDEARRPEIYEMIMKSVPHTKLPESLDGPPAKTIDWFKYDLCLSYASESTDIANHVRVAAGQYRGVTVYDYEHCPAPGRAVAETIGSVYRYFSRVPVVVVSPHSLMSDACTSEVRAIHDRLSIYPKIETVPVCLDPRVLEEYRRRFGDIEFVRSVDQIHAVVTRIVERLPVVVCQQVP